MVDQTSNDLNVLLQPTATADHREVEAGVPRIWLVHLI